MTGRIILVTHDGWSQSPYGGQTGSEDPFVTFYHDVPRALAEEAMSKEGDESDTAYHTRWPLEAWPAVPTRSVLCTQDRIFPPEFMRRVVRDRLGITPDEITAGHCAALSRPGELADLLVRHTTRHAARGQT
jgi:pimeloyl-ACP methyl ester carboxylesterase